MSESQDFHRFVIGEIRTDGWKSEWRIEQEERRKNQVFRPVAKEINPAPDKNKRRVRIKPVRPFWTPEPKKCNEPGCDKVLRRHCMWDKCRAHSKAMRGQKANEDRKARNAA